MGFCERVVFSWTSHTFSILRSVMNSRKVFPSPLTKRVVPLHPFVQYNRSKCWSAQGVYFRECFLRASHLGQFSLIIKGSSIVTACAASPIFNGASISIKNYYFDSLGKELFWVNTTHIFTTICGISVPVQPTPAIDGLAVFELRRPRPAVRGLR